MSILMVVVLPAPLGPSSPNSSPRSTVKLTPRTASTTRRLARQMPDLDRNERVNCSTSMTDIPPPCRLLCAPAPAGHAS